MIIVRHALDDFMALKIANSMDKAGVNVFSISTWPDFRSFIIYGKVEDDFNMDTMDNIIANDLDGKGGE